MPPLNPHWSTIGAVHDHHRRHEMGGGVHAAQVHLGLGECQRGGEHDRKGLGRTSGEHGVDRHEPARHCARQGRQHGEHLVGIAHGERQHGVDAIGRRRHEGEAIAQTALLEHRQQALGRVVDELVQLGLEGGHHVSSSQADC